MKIEHVRLAAALATVIEARGGDFRPICVDLKLKPRDVLAFSQGHHDFSAQACRRIRAYLHLKHADVMRALGDDAPASTDLDWKEVPVSIEIAAEDVGNEELALELGRCALQGHEDSLIEKLAEPIHAITCGCDQCRAGSPA